MRWLIAGGVMLAVVAIVAVMQPEPVIRALLPVWAIVFYGIQVLWPPLLLAAIAFVAWGVWRRRKP